jgi:hypothetical protein
VKNNEPINELDLIFLPLTKSKNSKLQILKDTVEIEKEIKCDISVKEKIIAMTLVLLDKFVERKEIEKIWEAIKILKFIEIAEEKGIEKGMEKGIDNLQSVIIDSIEIKYDNMPVKMLPIIKNINDPEILKMINRKVMKSETIEDVSNYLSQLEIPTK